MDAGAHAVTLALGDERSELLVYAGISLPELRRCVGAGFSRLAGAPDAAVALRHAELGVFYPLSLLSRAPAEFQGAVFEVVAEGDALTAARATARRPHRRRHANGARKGAGVRARRAEATEGAPATTADEAEAAFGDERDVEEEDRSDEDENEFMREIDLTDFELPMLVNVFAQACPTGALDRASFERCLEKILSQSGRYDPQARKMFTRLFQIFERRSRRSDVVDVAEFLGGVSVFACGERDEKIRLTFELYDSDSDGFISKGEMTKYLTAVYLVISETSPELFHQNKVEPAELGVITAQQCFAESVLNTEGKLSYDAFREWYSKPGPTHLVAPGTFLPPSSRPNGTGRAVVAASSRFPLNNLAALREATGLSTLRAHDLFSIFSPSVNDGGVLTKDAFKQTFFAILRKQNRVLTREIVAFLDRLFATLDLNDDGTVDYVELCSGLSILCGGTSEDKVAAAFSLFDADGDGFITPEEMETYLASVFSVMYEADRLIAAQPGMIDARSLAHYTTLQAFADADKNHDGKLSLEEFRKWYSPPTMLAHQQAFGGPVQSFQQTASTASHPPQVPLNHTQTLSAIDFVGSITGLRNRKPSDVFEFIAAKVNDDGVLSRDSFFAVFNQLIEDANGGRKRKLKPQEEEHLKHVLDTIFNEFDTDHDGFVDFCELSSGISILCGGSNDDKVKAAFGLFDINQDGFISREEMETYLASVFRTVFATSPGTAHQFRNVSAEQLAQLTTADAFDDADLNNDGRLSYEEFTKWYASQGGILKHSAPASSAPSIQPQGQSQAPPRRMISTASRGALQEMKDLTNLGSYDVNDIFEFFRASADKDGNFTQAIFFRCFNKLLAKEGAVDRRMQARTQQLLQELFDLFDTDRNGTIDVQELGAGLSILCGGKVEDKAQSLFTLYDINHDGFISPEEMDGYLTAVFKVMYKASPELYTRTQMPPEQLAQATTIECFQLFDHNGDGQLSLEEFREWFHRQNSHANRKGSVSSTTAPANGSNAPASGSNAASPDPIPIEVAKKLSGLKSVPLETAMEVFANAMGEDGRITRQNFDSCFYRYLCANVSTELTAAESTRVHEVIDRLFSAFDTDHNGFVDFNELSSGLSILCGGGTRDAKVQAAFDLYDANGDGLISEDDMTHYLSSVFKLLFALDPSREQELGISAEELAAVTAGEIFAIADTNQDGKLTFEEFQKWYSQPEQVSFNEIVAPLDLNEVRQLTNLGNLDVVEVFERFAEHADNQGLLNHEAFDRCFFEIVGMAAHPRTQIEKLRAKVVADRLFDVFDRDKNGQIDFSELAGGLSVLCKGARDAKVRAAFSLYDFNGDGFISLDEMTRYLTSIFKVLYEVQPGMRQETGVSPEELGSVTAEQAFLEADINRDGKLSYDEFLTWYNSPAQAGISSAVAKNAIVDSSLRWMPLNEIKQLTNLAQYEPEEVFEIFAAEADQNGSLSREAFNESFHKIIDRDETAVGNGVDSGKSFVGAALRPSAFKEKVQRVVNDLFDLFDTDHSGTVDFGELASGLSVLCGGTKEQKVQAAFSLFDFNGDGYISLEEMTRYLTSVFRVLFQVSPDTQSLGVSPEELGQVTAQQAFAEADEDHDGRLTLEEFQKWYQQPGGIGEVAKNGEQLFSLAEARRLTNLDAFSPIQVFEALADCADEQGYVSRTAFDECFRKMIAANDGLRAEHQYEHIEAILDRLFALFDVDKNGLVDFSELSSGLSVFCGGTSEEKVRAAFALYDYNGDGFISQEEMARYLTSVFKVLKEASPGALLFRSKSGNSDSNNEHLPRETPEELGARTAQQAFAEADIDRDGRLSFNEFRAWYTKSSAANIERLIQNNLPEWLSLREVRRLTNLGAFSANQVLDAFSKYTSPATRTIDRDGFRQAMNHFKAGATNASPDASDRLHLLVDRLFDLFDKDKNGVVDFAELASGVSVLCGGSAQDKVRSAFNLYDVNHDGFVSLGEMRLYLTSVFKVLFDVHPESAKRMGVSAEELATITAEQAFAEADMDRDGKLSFEEFSHWYMSSSGVSSTASSAGSSSSSATPSSSPRRVPDWVSLQVVKDLTRLDKHSPTEVFELFAGHCAEDGTISRDAFEVCFEQLMDEEYKSDSTRLARVRLVLDRLFDIFDLDGNGVVDFCELTSGLSVLCGGSREDKVRSAFALYDLNQDGYIALEEMTRYLTSVFKVLYETNPDTPVKLGVSPEELAAITAEQCFIEADLNRDGKLSFDEFVKWYTKTGGFGNIDGATPAEKGRVMVGSFAPIPHSETAPDDNEAEDEEEKEESSSNAAYHLQPDSPLKTIWGAGASASTAAPTSSAPATNDADEDEDEDSMFPSSKIYGFSTPNGDTLLSPSSASALNMNSANMDRVRHLLKLNSYEVNDVFEIFAEAAPSGELSFASFKKCFDQIIRLAGGHASLDEKQEADAMVRRLFKVFDTDNSNTVDFGELASGLSVLSGSSMDDKVRAAFQLYDINGDGFITQDEMINYMTSIFRVMYETSDSTKSNMGVSPEELARVTAAQCFKEADVNHDDKLSFDEFKKWCTSGL